MEAVGIKVVAWMNINVKIVFMEPKRTKQLSKEDAAYLGGILDGEGTITLTSKHKGENRRLAVTISNTERDLLEWVLKTTGVGGISTKKIYNDKHSAPFTYQVCSKQAYDILIQVVSHLKSYKKFRAEIILKNYHQLTPRNGKYTPELLAKRTEFIKMFFKFRSKNSRINSFWLYSLSML